MMQWTFLLFPCETGKVSVQIDEVFSYLQLCSALIWSVQPSSVIIKSVQLSSGIMSCVQISSVIFISVQLSSAVIRSVQLSLTIFRCVQFEKICVSSLESFWSFGFNSVLSKELFEIWFLNWAANRKTASWFLLLSFYSLSPGKSSDFLENVFEIVNGFIPFNFHWFCFVCLGLHSCWKFVVVLEKSPSRPLCETCKISKRCVVDFSLFLGCWFKMFCEAKLFFALLISGVHMNNLWRVNKLCCTSFIGDKDMPHSVRVTAKDSLKKSDLVWEQGLHEVRSGCGNLPRKLLKSEANWSGANKFQLAVVEVCTLRLINIFWINRTRKNIRKQKTYIIFFQVNKWFVMMLRKFTAQLFKTQCGDSFDFVFFFVSQQPPGFWID